jgi:hypothetical protein
MDIAVEKTMVRHKPYSIDTHPYWSPRCQEVKELQMLALPQDYRRLHLQLCHAVRLEEAKFCTALLRMLSKQVLRLCTKSKIYDKWMENGLGGISDL